MPRKLVLARVCWSVFSERVENRQNELQASVVEATLVNSFKACLQKVQTTDMGFFIDTRVTKE